MLNDFGFPFAIACLVVFLVGPPMAPWQYLAVILLGFVICWPIACILRAVLKGIFHVN